MLLTISLIIGTALSLTSAYYQIDDIPIEHFNFDHDDLQNNAMDIELMPRFPKSFSIGESEEDPKEYFFRGSYSQYGDGYFDNAGSADEASEEEEKQETGERYKRDVTELTTEGIDRRSIVTTLGKPLELAVIDPENITEKSEEGVVVALESAEDMNFLINDFIRFKRSATTERMTEDVENVKKLMKDIDEKNKSKTATPEENSNIHVEELQPPHTEKLVMNHREIDDNDDLEALRETRGATKEQWVKQAYPVRRREELEDHPSSAAEREIVRAPRVHFVTQGMSESSLRPEYNRYDREARARNLNKELSWNLARDPYRDMEYYQPRYTRNYVPPAPSRSNYRDDRYYNYDSRTARDPYYDYPARSRYREYPERPLDNYNTNYNNYNNYSGSKGRQRRIVYYATLPDISRSPPNVNLRDRYDFRDRYENRYFSPESSHQLRKPYTKPRYDANDNRKPDYPLKVSTDVNVREVKKNPEGRVYAEVNQNRFAQNPNYRNDRA